MQRTLYLIVCLTLAASSAAAQQRSAVMRTRASAHVRIIGPTGYGDTRGTTATPFIKTTI